MCVSIYQRVGGLNGGLKGGLNRDPKMKRLRSSCGSRKKRRIRKVRFSESVNTILIEDKKEMKEKETSCLPFLTMEILKKIASRKIPTRTEIYDFDHVYIRAYKRRSPFFYTVKEEDGVWMLNINLFTQLLIFLIRQKMLVVGCVEKLVKKRPKLSDNYQRLNKKYPQIT